MDQERSVGGQPVGCSIGVTTGDVFYGSVGNSHRSEFAMVGSVVNLAARLMAAGMVSHPPPLSPDSANRRSLSRHVAACAWQHEAGPARCGWIGWGASANARGGGRWWCYCG